MNKKIINQIVKIVSAKQNEKLKLNAGAWREAISLIFNALYELDLTVLKDSGKDKTDESNFKEASKKSNKKSNSKKEII